MKEEKVYYDDYERSYECKSICPQTPLQCCLGDGHKGNHEVFYYDYFLWFFCRTKVIEAEWTPKNKLVYLSTLWRQNMKDRKEFERR